ncbi:Uncharacterized protein FKW44_018793 [Caligus rogercresseyi]|uniref:Uncharacterized protein n=1 Tax=Caligus rogercresseyi TaxID=217165 RepID=A0A7T8GVK5_CALRO|nr:Uncharacterized protein FKW44_018793 [Caligus rogercresseyi]
MPAFFCGIFGHKCSTGEPVSNSGQLPPCNESTNSFLSTGPMTRHSKDLLPAFKALIANEEIIQTRLRLSEPVDLSSLKIYCLKDYGISGFPLMSKLSEELYEAQSGVVRDLECELGLPVENLELEEFYWSFNIWNQKMNAEPDIPSFTQLLNDAQQPPISPWMELLKWMCFKSTNYTLISIGE